MSLWGGTGTRRPAGRRDIRFHVFSARACLQNPASSPRGFPRRGGRNPCFEKRQAVDADEDHLVRPGLLELHELHPRPDFAGPQHRRPTGPHGFARQTRGDARCVHREAGRQRLDAGHPLGPVTRVGITRRFIGRCWGTSTARPLRPPAGSAESRESPPAGCLLADRDNRCLSCPLPFPPGITPPAPTGAERAPRP